MGPAESAVSEAKGAQELGFAEAFAVAKQALTYIGTYRTPPTPQIYELWFRYVEGKDRALHDELSSILERQSLDMTRLTQLSQQYFPEVDGVDLQHRATNVLAEEILVLQKLLEEQSHAGKDFRQQILLTNETLKRQRTVSVEHQSCVDDVLACNARMHAKLAETELQLAASQQHINVLRRELLDSQKALLTDNLTGIGNRRFFDLLMQQALEGKRSLESMEDRHVLTLIDLDGFKEVNDTLGHSSGDEVLRFAAHEMQCLAGHGSVARLGGDEFGVLQRLESNQPADSLGQAIQQFFSEKKLVLEHSGTDLGKLTASVGVALLRSDDTRNSWFERADKLLYSAKKSGKNCVMCEREIR